METEESSRVVKLAAGISAAALTFTAVAWSADVPLCFYMLVYTEQFPAFVLALALGLVFLCVRIDRSQKTVPPWYDVCAGLLELLGAGYAVVAYPTMAEGLAYNHTGDVVASTGGQLMPPVMGASAFLDPVDCGCNEFKLVWLLQQTV